MIVYYNESILSYVASIRNYLGLDSSYKSNSKFDAYIKEKKPSDIILFLVDGMGANLIEQKLPEDSFLRKNLFKKVQTVFPPTTTAATTSIRNGNAPNENAWLAWTQTFKEVNDVVIPFLGCSYYGDKHYGGRSFGENAIPITCSENDLNKIGKKGRKLFPSFEDDGCEDIDTMCRRLIKYSKSKEYDYIYAYWDKYDTYCHEYGPSDKICDAYLTHINYELENLANNLSQGTMLVIVADHGQIDISRVDNLYNSKYEKYFKALPDLETRCIGFWIKEEYKDEFAKEFMNDYEEDYLLLTHQQVLDTNLFGDHENHPRFEEFIGDFVAIAKSKISLAYDRDGSFNLKGHHAGMHIDELMIPVITYIK